MPRGRVLTLALVALAGAPLGCAHGLLSGVQYPDRSRPVARIETRGGVEFGATTTEGILFLGRTAQQGPCRVHYFLGPAPTPMVEDGEIRHLGGGFYRAEIDLKHQSVPLLERDPTPGDELVAMVHAGLDVREVPVRMVADDTVEGDVLAWPGRPLPAGAAIFRRGDEGLEFVGLVSGSATIETGGRPRRYLTFAGPDRLREMLAVPRLHPGASTIVHRPDDISVIKPR